MSATARPPGRAAGRIFESAGGPPGETWNTAFADVASRRAKPLSKLIFRCRGLQPLHHLHHPWNTDETSVKRRSTRRAFPKRYRSNSYAAMLCVRMWHQECYRTSRLVTPFAAVRIFLWRRLLLFIAGILRFVFDRAAEALPRMYAAMLLSIETTASGPILPITLSTTATTTIIAATTS